MGAIHAPPYFEVSSDENEVTGLIPQILEPIFAPLNISVAYKTLPPKRLRKELIDGFPLVNMKKNTDTVLLTDIYLTASNYVWTERSKFPGGIQWERYSDLKDYSIGIVKGAGYGEDTDKFIANNSDIFYRAESSPVNVKLLISGRLDAIFSNEDIISKYNKNGNLIPSKKALFTNNYKIAISLKSKYSSRIDEINERIKLLKKLSQNKYD